MARLSVDGLLRSAAHVYYPRPASSTLSAHLGSFPQAPMNLEAVPDSRQKSHTSKSTPETNR